MGPGGVLVLVWASIFGWGSMMPWSEFLIVSASVLLADQLSKLWVLGEQRFCRAAEHQSFLSIRCIINRRAAVIPLRKPWILFGGWVVCMVFALSILSHEPLAHSVSGATGVGLA